MRRRITMRLVVLGLGLALVVTGAPTRWRNRVLGWIGADCLVLQVRPAATPFDQANLRYAAHYRDVYARGYAWAWGRRRCPPSVWPGWEWVEEVFFNGFAAGREDGGSYEFPMAHQPE